MPTYEYACKSCGEHVEVVQSFKDDPLTTCPNCSGELRKVFGSIGIAFKGSGFYKTDSRSATKSGGAHKEPAKSTADTTSGDTSSSSGGSSDKSSGDKSSGSSTSSDSTSSKKSESKAAS